MEIYIRPDIFAALTDMPIVDGPTTVPSVRGNSLNYTLFVRAPDRNLCAVCMAALDCVTCFVDSTMYEMNIW